MGRTTKPSPSGAKPAAANDDAETPGAKPAKKRRPNKKKSLNIPKAMLEGEVGPINTHWRTYFLQALAETSNVTAACEKAGVATQRAYSTRFEDAEFAAAWRVALARGYDNLEMELLGYLRNPSPAFKMDITGAIRLLVMHREAVARQRAFEDRRSEQDVLESLDAMIDDMRQRRLALPAPTPLADIAP
jgi:hypothetical protein